MVVSVGALSQQGVMQVDEFSRCGFALMSIQEYVR